MNMRQRPHGKLSRSSTRAKTEGGSTLLITVISCVLVGTVLCSYLMLIMHRNTSAMRATAWNTAIPVLEAGIEEALTHLQVDANKPTANGWTADTIGGQTVYWKRRFLPDGSYFSVTNFNFDSPSPVIMSAGYVKAPLKEHQRISRLVRVTATNPPSVFTHAIAADGAIKLSGGSVIDGFKSKGFANALAAYNTRTNRNSEGGVATNSKDQKAIDVGSAHIYGSATTGPGGSVAVAGGTVGDFDWSELHTGIEPGWTNDNMNVHFQNNSPPTGKTMTPGPKQVGISNITFLKEDSSSVIYKTDNFITNDKTKPMVVIGNCTLWVPGDFVVTGSGYIYVAPGASLKLYVGGVASISGGGIVNGAGLPQNFSYFGLPSNKTLNYNGAANFIGTINAPQADFNISGGASVYGAVICKTFTSSGGSSVHYDQSLGGGGIFMVTSWKEM